MRVAEYCIFAKMQIVLLSFFAFASTTFCEAQDWPQFRGINGTATTKIKIPEKWTDKNVKWRLKLPGKGWSSPVHVSGKAWMTSAITKKASPEELKKKLKGVQFARIKTAASSVEFHALCVDLKSGNLLHDVLLGTASNPQPINPMNSYASPTCSIAEGKVVCHFGAYGTWCLDSQTGEKLWDTKYVIDHSVGPGSSPIIADSKVILVCDGCDQQFVAAVNLNDGKEIWKTARPPIRETNGEFRKAYCTPIVRTINGAQQVIVTGAQWICGYDLNDGKEVWRLDYGRGYSVTGMPILFGESVIFVTGYDFHEMISAKMGTGALPKSNIEWKSRGVASMSSAVVYKDKVFAISDRGILSIIDPKNGQMVKKIRTIANVSSSPLLADGKLFFGNRDGKFVTIKADESLEELHRSEFNSGVYASPSISEGDLLIRTENELIRIGKS